MLTERQEQVSLIAAGARRTSAAMGGGGADEDWPRVSPGKMDNIGHSTL